MIRLKKISSCHPGRVDFLAGQVTFYALLPSKQVSRQVMNHWLNQVSNGHGQATCEGYLLKRQFFLALSRSKWLLWTAKNRVHTGYGKPGKSWNLRISFSRPGKSWNVIVGTWESWKMKALFGRLVTADDKARTIKHQEE